MLTFSSIFNQDYEKAASLYEVILKNNPANSNIEAKLGICYSQC